MIYVWCVWHGAWLPYSYRLECILWLVASNLMFQKMGWSSQSQLTFAYLSGKPQAVLCYTNFDYLIADRRRSQVVTALDIFFCAWTEQWKTAAGWWEVNGNEFKVRNLPIVLGWFNSPHMGNYRYGSTTFLLELARHGPMEGLQGYCVADALSRRWSLRSRMYAEECRGKPFASWKNSRLETKHHVTRPL